MHGVPPCAVSLLTSDGAYRMPTCPFVLMTYRPNARWRRSAPRVRQLPLPPASSSDDQVHIYTAPSETARRPVAPAPSSRLTILAVLGRSGAGTAAPAPSAPTVRRPGPPVVALARRGSHESEINIDRLVEELGLVGAVDSGACLLQRRVLNESVALRKPSQ